LGRPRRARKISVQWHSCQNRQGISAKKQFLAFCQKKARKIKLPFSLAGNRNYNNASLNNQGSNGNYWSSTVTGTNAYNLNFNSGNANMNNNNRANGFSVRCLKDWYLPFIFYEYVFR
jgi:uncharacterized protein (TIGR02145 family)